MDSCTGPGKSRSKVANILFLPKNLFGEAQLLPIRHKSKRYGSENHHIAECTHCMASTPDTAAFCVAAAQASMSNEYAHALSGICVLPFTMLQFAKDLKAVCRAG